MSNNKIPDCCVAAVHQRLINILDFQQRLPNVTYLRCHYCTKCYRLAVRRSEALSPKIDGTRYDVVYEDVVYVKGEDEVQSGFECFVVPAESQYYGSLEFVNDDEESEKVDEL